MNMWQKSAGAAALLLLTNVAPAFAETFDAQLIMAPISLPFTEVGAKHYLPHQITVAGKLVTLDQQAVLQGEILYVPLRFIVEAAGGKVAWDGATQTVSVQMPDRTAAFVIGQTEAEMNENGVTYIQRNMIKMAGPVQNINGRTMISADALTTILGLVERSDKDLSLDLITLAAGEVGGHIQIVPTAIEQSAAPAELVAWAGAQKVEGGVATHTIVTTAEGRYLAIAGGQRPSGGYTIEIVGANLVEGTWMIEVAVVAPEGPATAVITNPVAYFALDGMDGEIEVHFVNEAPSAPATGKVIPGSAQVAAVAVERANLSAEMAAWADSMVSAEEATFKVYPVADGVIVGIAGGLQSSGGYTIELLGGGARLVDGTWYLDAKVVPPTGMATMALTNPVAFFKLPGVSGNVEVTFWTNGATP